MLRDIHLQRHPRACALLTICLVLLACVLVPARSLAEGDKVVKVGWYDSSYCYFDDFGRRRSVAYECQRPHDSGAPCVVICKN